MKIFKKTLLSILLASVCLLPSVCFATLNTKLQQEDAFLNSAGLNTSARIDKIAAMAIQTVLGLLAIIFIVLLIYAGFQWMTAEGDEGKIEKAQKTISHAVIGLIIVIAAYSITFFVFNALNSSAGSSGGTQNQGGSSS
jgi:amino acid transporter